MKDKFHNSDTNLLCNNEIEYEPVKIFPILLKESDPISPGDATNEALLHLQPALKTLSWRVLPRCLQEPDRNRQTRFLH